MASRSSRELKYEMFGVKLYSDGFVDRTTHHQLYPSACANAQQAFLGAYSKDIVIDSSTGCWARIYLPAQYSAASQVAGLEGKKLPVLFYFHGGGFVVCTAASVHYHDFCSKMAAGAETIVISVNYRLAPEHKLPAPYDDGMASLSWLRKQAELAATGAAADSELDPWISSHADLCSCFLMGDSAGANIVAHLALRTATQGVHPLCIRGLILSIPFFGGVERTNSEMLYDGSIKMTLADTDHFWEVSLPADHKAGRNHRYCVFFTPENRALLHRVKLLPSLVVLGSTDLMHDRQIQYVEFVREAGHSVTLQEYSQYDHDIQFPEVNRPEDVAEAYSILRSFLGNCVLHDASPASTKGLIRPSLSRRRNLFSS